MAQSRAAGEQKKGKNVPIGDAPPIPISSGSISVPSIGSGATTTTLNVEGRMNLENIAGSRKQISLVEVCHKRSRVRHQVEGRS